MKIGEEYESPRTKAKRLFESGRVKIIKDDDFEKLFLVNGNFNSKTEVSYIKKSHQIKCFNSQCSLWRSKTENKEICYHIHIVRMFLNEEFKNK